jgi:eukaryotic-like serine/threonine-protein kinase
MDEEALFAAALAKALPAERHAFLARACAGDAKCLARIEALLHAHEQPDSFLEPPPVPLIPTVSEPVAERAGTVIGSYKLLEQIGEGGFGVVFMAEQQEPLRRRVALKVLKPGMETRQVVARFEAERQALALMDHPHIAHVFDGGHTASGRPYFVMELVKGVPITQYCDEHNLAIRERLELFVTVCQAVQHAHQKGIIHRDLKPSNILVSVHDTVPVAKVIDFGIAKATGQQLTTLFTNFAQLIGTPMYMSPEQAQLNGVDIDTRTDIYALGVLLYELLTGTTPFDAERLRTAGYDELRRIIREEEPARPSTRMSTLVPATRAVLAQRQYDGGQLSQLLRGELDWIVMKALDKHRDRRYETASAFAADVQRYLHDEPVLARLPSVGYRLRKMVRRNRGAVMAVVVVMLVLIGGIIGTTWGLIRAWQAEENAVAEAKEKGVLAQVLAQKQQQTQAALEQAKKNFQLASALTHNKPLRHQLDWLERQSQRPQRHETMKKGLIFFRSLVGEPGPDPGERLLTAEVRIELADIYFFLDQPAEAGAEYEKAIALLQPMQTEFPKEAGFRDSLGHCFKQKGWLWRSHRDPARVAEGEAAFQQAVTLYEGLRQEFSDVLWYRMQLAACWRLLGELQRKTDRFGQAEQSHQHALTLYQEVFTALPEESEERAILANSHNQLAWVLAIRPDWRPHHAAEALAHAQKAVTLDPANHDLWHTLGVAHCRLGHAQQALAAIAKSRDLDSDKGPPGSFDRFFEAMAYSQLGERDMARRCYDEAVEWMQKHAPDHPDLSRFRVEAARTLGIQR